MQLSLLDNFRVRAQGLWQACWSLDAMLRQNLPFSAMWLQQAGQGKLTLSTDCAHCLWFLTQHHHV